MVSQRISALTPLAEVLAHVEKLAHPVVPREVAFADAEGRVLAADGVAAASPATPIALIDGWAVHAEQVTDAGPYAPVLLEPAPGWVDAGDAMPDGTDAVLPPDAVANNEVHASATAGDGVLAAGADAAPGQPLRRRGERLRAADAAALQAVGVWGVAIESVAAMYRLGFVRLSPENYDFLLVEARRERPAVAAFLKALADPVVRKRIHLLGMAPV